MKYYEKVTVYVDLLKRNFVKNPSIMYNKIKYLLYEGDSMAGQFRNTNLGYYLYSAIVIVIGVSSLIVFWFMISGTNIGRYAENTRIGSVYIGGRNQQEAEIKLADSIEEWYVSEEVLFEIMYQGYTYEINRQLFTFDQATSIANVQDGRTVPLVAFMTDENKARVIGEIMALPFMQGLEDQFDLEALLDDLERDARELRLFTRRQLNAYIRNEDNLFVVLFETTQPRPSGNMPPIEVPSHIDGQALYNKLIAQYPQGFTLEPNRVISILNTFDTTFTNQELSFLGTLFLDAIPYMHFTVFERDFVPFIDTTRYTEETFPLYGRNVRVHRSQGIDFSFENNSPCRFRVTFDITGNFLSLRIIGAPYLNTITVSTEIYVVPYQIQTITPPTTERAGIEGRIIYIYREIFDLNSQPMNRSMIVFEYYPPLAELRYE